MRRSRDRERRLLRTWLDQIAELRRPSEARESFEIDQRASEESRTGDTDDPSIGGWAREASS